MLLPCQNVLKQKIARCNYVTYMRKYGHLINPQDNSHPTDHSCKKVDGLYVPHWFSGSQMSTVLSETLEPEDIEEDKKDSEETDDRSDESENKDDSDDYTNLNFQFRVGKQTKC